LKRYHREEISWGMSTMMMEMSIMLLSSMLEQILRVPLGYSFFVSFYVSYVFYSISYKFFIYFVCFFCCFSCFVFLNWFLLRGCINELDWDLWGIRFPYYLKIIECCKIKHAETPSGECRSWDYSKKFDSFPPTVFFGNWVSFSSM